MTLTVSGLGKLLSNPPIRRHSSVDGIYAAIILCKIIVVYLKIKLSISFVCIDSDKV